jgi:hypothetical protein
MAPLEAVEALRQNGLEHGVGGMRRNAHIWLFI